MDAHSWGHFGGENCKKNHRTALLFALTRCCFSRALKTSRATNWITWMLWLGFTFSFLLLSRSLFNTHAQEYGLSSSLEIEMLNFCFREIQQPRTMNATRDASTFSRISSCCRWGKFHTTNESKWMRTTILLLQLLRCCLCLVVCCG